MKAYFLANKDGGNTAAAGAGAGGKKLVPVFSVTLPPRICYGTNAVPEDGAKAKKEEDKDGDAEMGDAHASSGVDKKKSDDAKDRELLM